MAKWGVPLLPRGRQSASTKLAMKTDSCAKIPVPVKKPKTLKSAERMLEEQRIVLESLLESINKHLGGTEGSKKKISSLTMQLRQHIAAGYRCPILPTHPNQPELLLSSYWKPWQTSAGRSETPGSNQNSPRAPPRTIRCPTNDGCIAYRWT